MFNRGKRICACGLYYSAVSAGLLSKTPSGRTVSWLLCRDLRGEEMGIGSCILTFDPRVLFTGVLIQRMEAHCGSYHPPGNSTEASWFLFVVGLNVYLRCVERFLQML